MNPQDRRPNGHAAFELGESFSLSVAEGERENRPPRLRQSRAPRLVAARVAVFPLPAGEGKGEGERDAANQNGPTNFASSTPPVTRLRVELCGSIRRVEPCELGGQRN